MKFAKVYFSGTVGLFFFDEDKEKPQCVRLGFGVNVVLFYSSLALHTIMHLPTIVKESSSSTGTSYGL